jgi:CheY-like chemotaxis protein
MNSKVNTGKILIVDDEPLNLKLVARTLVNAGYATTLASSGEEAMDCLAAEQFDAVVSDVLLPRMSGFELLQSLHVRFPHLPVILMTALAQADMREAALAWGATAFFEKPVKREELIAALRAAMRQAVSPSFALATEAVSV